MENRRQMGTFRPSLPRPPPQEKSQSGESTTRVTGHTPNKDGNTLSHNRGSLTDGGGSVVPKPTEWVHPKEDQEVREQVYFHR